MNQSNQTIGGSMLHDLRSMPLPNTSTMSLPTPTPQEQPSLLERLRAQRNTNGGLIGMIRSFTSPQGPHQGGLLKAAGLDPLRNETPPGPALQNFRKGFVEGMVMIPDDSVADPTDPMPAVRIASMFLGGAVEGFIGDMFILRGLTKIKNAAAAAGKLRIASSASAALKVFEGGEDAGKIRKLLGQSALGASSEVALQTAAGNSPMQILSAAGMVAVAGAAFGGAIHATTATARAAAVTPRAIRSAAEVFIEGGGASGVNRMHREALATMGTADGAWSAAGDILARESKTAPEDLIRELERVDPLKKKSHTLPKDYATTGIDAIDSQFSIKPPATDPHAKLADAWEAFRRTFQHGFDVSKYSHTLGIDGLSMADNMRTMRQGVDRADANAVDWVRHILRPILDRYRGKDAAKAVELFERIVVLRDWQETAAKGFEVPGGVSQSQITEALEALERKASPEVQLATVYHKLAVNDMRQELVRRGKLDQASGYDNYFPHQIIEDFAIVDAAMDGDKQLATLWEKLAHNQFTDAASMRSPSRRYVRKRGGSTRAINTDYVTVMWRARRRFERDNIVDDFLNQIRDAHALDPKGLNDLEKAAIRHRTPFVRQEADGTRRVYQAFYHTGGPSYYRMNAVDDEALSAIIKSLEENKALADLLPEGASFDDLVREVLAVGKRPYMILPKEITDHLNTFYEDPLRNLANKTLLGFPLRATSWWKRNTIWWGLSRFFMFQVIGDSINLARSNPRAFAHVPAAIDEILRYHGMPAMSTRQAIGALAGGAAAITIDDIMTDPDNPDSLIGANVLVAAGLGYLLGSASAKRYTRFHPRGVSHIYEEADRLAAINSGFVFSEESVAQRALGGAAPHLPTFRATHKERSWDTVRSLLQGKTSGNPYRPVAVPLDMLQTIQTERENVLRLASFMQMKKAGVPEEIAAKRAREALVDYGKFTDVENKIIRGFLLPFYSFYRHNIPNWIRAAAHKDVGGKPTVALLATASIATADIAVGAWNAQFPDVESRLQAFRKDRFHIIIGNPISGEVYLNDAGQPMILGWEMPYEQTLELLGLSRPGAVVTQLLGASGDTQFSSLRRAQQMENEAGYKKVSKVIYDRMRGIATGAGALGEDLLNPFVKEPIQLWKNGDWYYDAPIVPDRYFNTPEGKWEMVHHIAETFFRQIREFRRFATDVTGSRFDFSTSAFGLGIPMYKLNMEREIQGTLHERMDEAQAIIKNTQAPWKKSMDDLIYSRQDFTQMEEGETQKAWDIVQGITNTADQRRAWDYYMTRGAQGSLVRRWQALSAEERLELMATIDQDLFSALTFYLNTNGMQRLTDHLDPFTKFKKPQ